MPKIQQKMRIILAHSFIVDALLCCMQMVMPPSIPRQRSLRDRCVIVGVSDVSTTIIFYSCSSVKIVLKKICIVSVLCPVRVRNPPWEKTPMGGK